MLKIKGKTIKEAYKIYFKFLKYFNLIDIFVLMLLYIRNYIINNNLDAEYGFKIHIFVLIIFIFAIINNIYHINKIEIKRKISFIIMTACIKLFSYQLTTILLLRLNEVKNFENIVMSLIWLGVGYCFLNTYGFILEDTKNKY